MAHHLCAACRSSPKCAAIVIFQTPFSLVAVASARLLPHRVGNVNIDNCCNFDAMMKTRRCVMSRASLPARSLRRPSASLRTVPEGAGGLFRKRLIWRALLVMRPAISWVEPIFLPALRESSGWDGWAQRRGEGNGRGHPLPDLRASLIARQTRSGVAGISMWRMP
jgi:hypothetical protein